MNWLLISLSVTTITMTFISLCTILERKEYLAKTNNLPNHHRAERTEVRGLMQLDRFKAGPVYDRTGIKISTRNTEVSCFSWNPRQGMLQVRGNGLEQVEKFKYFGVSFTSDGRQNMEIDTWIGKGNSFLCKLYLSVVTKRGAFKHCKAVSF